MTRPRFPAESVMPAKSVRWYGAIAVASVVLAVVPFIAETHVMVFLVEALALLVLAYSWNLISGYTGYFTLGHIAFFGLGGYASAISLQAGVPWPVALLVAGVAPAILAALVGPIILRLRSIAFAVTAFGIARILESVAILAPWTGGGAGLYLLPPMTVETIYVLLVVLAGVSVAATYAIDNSTFGLRLLAIREDQDAAAAMGLNTRRYKRIAFTLSSVLPGVAGALFTFHLAYIDPINAFLPVRELMVAAGVLLGGFGTVLGPLVGMSVLLLTYEAFWASLPWLYQIIAGAVVMITVLFMPRGLVHAAALRWPALAGRQAVRRQADLVHRSGAAAPAEGDVPNKRVRT